VNGNCLRFTLIRFQGMKGEKKTDGADPCIPF
jgi:hypothetical protein